MLYRFLRSIFRALPKFIRTPIHGFIRIILNPQNILFKRTDFILLPLTTRKKDVVSCIEPLRPYHVGYDLIRLGPKEDGGYLVPDDLEGIKACFSPGVAGVSDFEKDCYDRGMELFLADKSVEKANLGNVPHSFIKKFIGCTNDDDFITLDKWVETSNISKNDDLLLQIDIEGAEYSVFSNVSDRLMSQFRIIVCEFHFLDQLWNGFYFNIANNVFKKLIQTHTCTHIHPNNCGGEVFSLHRVPVYPVMEFTFIRNDRVKSKTPCKTFPHPLDFDNVVGLPSSVLPKIWYSS